MLPITDKRPSRWPAVSGLILASGFLLLGLARPAYAAAFSILIISFATVVLLWRPHRQSSQSVPQQVFKAARAIKAGLLCYLGFVLILIAQMTASVVGLAEGAALTTETFFRFNLDLNKFVPIINLLLIVCGYRILSQGLYIERFLYYYFVYVSVIWHLSFLTWQIDSNAVLFYYSEWSRSTFSGPVINANHSAVITFIVFVYFSIQFCKEVYSDKKSRLFESNFWQSPLIIGLQAAVFLYYTIQANSLMVNVTTFSLCILLFCFCLFPKQSRLLYLISSAATLGLAIAYVTALVILDPTRISLFGFEARQVIGREALNLIVERPILGYGTGAGYLALLGRSMTAIPEFIFQSAHSYYLDFLLQYGAAGFLLAIAGMFAVPMTAWIRHGRQEKFRSSTAILIWMMWLVLLLTALTDFALSIPSVSMLLCFLTGGVYRQIADSHTGTKALVGKTTAAATLK